MKDRQNSTNGIQQVSSNSKWNLSNKLSLCSIIVAVLSVITTVIVTIATSQISNSIIEALGSNPELRVQRDNLTISWNEQGRPVGFASDQMSGLDAAEDGYLYIPSIYFTNIGNDTALDVDVDWHLISNLDQINQQTDTTITIKESFSDGSVEIVSIYGNNFPSYVVNKPEDSISFIQAQRKEGISIPVSLLDSIAFYCFQKFPSNNTKIDYSRSFKDVTMPNISISVSYKNAMNTTRIDALDINFRPIAYEKNQNGSGYCRFEIASYDKSKNDHQVLESA